MFNNDIQQSGASARLEQIVDDVKMEAGENGLELCFHANTKPLR
ncbi:hypothetical protein [Bacillus sp. S/N-304-OC-R1]|nr:hypothetical protein [Bacillus sp. S/N-304-OC-R1]